MDATILVPVGLGLTVIGAGLGIGKFAAAAAEGIARQPEAADKISGAVQLPLLALLLSRLFYSGGVIGVAPPSNDPAYHPSGNVTSFLDSTHWPSLIK